MNIYRNIKYRIYNINFNYIKYSKYIYMLDIFNGIFIIFKNFFVKKVTLNFPLEKGSLGDRFKGEHMLRMYKSGVERCIICKLCENVCPAIAIDIDTESTSSLVNKKNDVDSVLSYREAFDYNLDMTKCIYCGLCQESCPVDAIVEGYNMNYTKVLHEELLYDKGKLLENSLR